MHRLARPVVALCLSPTLLLAQGDDCTDPKPVTVGSYGPYSTAGATTSFAWPCGNGGADIWFVAQANAAGSATFDTCGSSFDTCLEVFDGSGGCGALTSLGCNDDSCGTRSSVTVTVTAGQLLYARVGGFNAATGLVVLNVAGNLGIAAGFADEVEYGEGCYNARASFYEFIQQPANFDLSNSSFTMVPTSSGGYTIVPGFAPYTAPTASATPLVMGDDTVTTVNLTTPFPTGGTTTPAFEVCSNGYVSTAAGNGTSAVIVVQNFLDAPYATWRNWHDYDPSAGGQVWFEEVGTTAFITWDAVPDWNVAGSQSTFQFQFDSATGFVTFAFAQMSLTGSGGGGNGHLIGFSPDGTSLDPGAIDLSTSIPTSFSIAAADTFELQLSASARPVLGSSLTLETTNVPASSGLGAQILSFTQVNPGLDLAGLGMPGCRQYLALDASVVLVPAGGTASWPTTLPASATFAGVRIYAQSAMLVPGANALGALSSNGVMLLVDVN
ncbi:MAG: hypothetical protein KDE27_27070 [Planctomycetes bacterium]|nr:hypothetical protein [Planctomycetota bacterium]